MDEVKYDEQSEKGSQELPRRAEHSSGNGLPVIGCRRDYFANYFLVHNVPFGSSISNSILLCSYYGLLI